MTLLVTRGPVSLPGFVSEALTKEGYVLVEDEMHMRASVVFEDLNGQRVMNIKTFAVGPAYDASTTDEVFTVLRGIAMIHRATPYVADYFTAVDIVDALKDRTSQDLKILSEFEFELLLLDPKTNQVRARYSDKTVRTEDFDWPENLDRRLIMKWVGTGK